MLIIFIEIFSQYVHYTLPARCVVKGYHNYVTPSLQPVNNLVDVSGDVISEIDCVVYTVFYYLV